MSAEVAALTAEASMSLADVDYSKTGKNEGSQCTFMGLVTLFGSMALVLFSVVGIVLSESSPVVIASGLFASLVVAPAALIQRYKLNKMSTFREVHNKLRADVNDLSDRNDEMQVTVGRLEKNAERVGNLEVQLGKLVEQQGGNASQFIGLVKENSSILNEMQEMIEADVLNNFMQILCTTDRDQGFDIDKSEIGEFIARIRAIPGVQWVDEAKIRAVLSSKQEGFAIGTIIEFARNSKKNPDLAKQFVKISSRSLIYK